jgi:hypothetical protein
LTTRLLTSIAIMSLGLLTAGCGQATTTTTQEGHSRTARPANGPSSPTTTDVSHSEAAVPRYAGVSRWPYDDDADNDHNDDENIPTFGHEPSGPERRAMVATLRRYYAAVVKRDGAQACAMFAKVFRKAVPIEYGRYGAPFEHGSTCAAVMSKVFDHYHRELLIQARRMKVIDARLEGEKGYVVVRPHSPCVREMCVLNTRELLIAKLLMQREGGSWRVEALFLKV